MVTTYLDSSPAIDSSYRSVQRAFIFLILNQIVPVLCQVIHQKK